MYHKIQNLTKEQNIIFQTLTFEQNIIFQTMTFEQNIILPTGNTFTHFVIGLGKQTTDFDPSDGFSEKDLRKIIIKDEMTLPHSPNLMVRKSQLGFEPMLEDTFNL